MARVAAARYTRRAQKTVTPYQDTRAAAAPRPAKYRVVVHRRSLRHLRARCARAFRCLLPCLAWLAWAGAAMAAPPAAPAAPDTPSLADCRGIKDLAFVAHLDDDLLFMNPDLAANIEAGGCVRVVYLTASDAGEGEPYMLGRERGVRAAYAYMAGQPDLWKEDAVRVDGYDIARFTLQGNPGVQLWHMRLQDPWLGEGWGSLTPL